MHVRAEEVAADQGAGQGQVVCVLDLARDLLHCVDARERPADHRVVATHQLGLRDAASRTASRILL